MNLALIDNPMVRPEVTFKHRDDPAPTVDVRGIIQQLRGMTSDLEDMVRELKAVQPFYDFDNYLVCAGDDLDKVHSRMLSVLEELEGEVN